MGTASRGQRTATRPALDITRSGHDVLAGGGLSLLQAVAAYKERSCAPGSRTAQATVVSCLGTVAAGSKEPGGPVGKGWSWQVRCGESVPTAPCTALLAAANTNALEQVSLAGLTMQTRTEHLLWAQHRMQGCPGKQVPWGRSVPTTGSLHPTRRLTRIKTSTDTLPGGTTQRRQCLTRSTVCP